MWKIRSEFVGVASDGRSTTKFVAFGGTKPHRGALIAVGPDDLDTVSLMHPVWCAAEVIETRKGYIWTNRPSTTCRARGVEANDRGECVVWGVDAKRARPLASNKAVASGNGRRGACVPCAPRVWATRTPIPRYAVL